VNHDDLHGKIRRLDHEFVELSPEVETDIGVIRVLLGLSRDRGVAIQLSVYGFPANRSRSS
jgi:hypothetical protein